MGFRPSIDGSLEELIDEYKERAGCDRRSEFVKHAVRKEVERIRRLEADSQGGD